MNRVKKITKTCSGCQKQVPTACKSCSCGFKFGKQTFDELLIKEEVNGNQVIRTKRRCREKPHFFDALEYDSNFKKKNNIFSSNSFKGAQKRKLRTTRQSLSENIEKSNMLDQSVTLNCDVPSPSSLKRSQVESPLSFHKFSDDRSFCNGWPDEDSWDCNLFRERNQTFEYILEQINCKILSVTNQPVVSLQL